MKPVVACAGALSSRCAREELSAFLKRLNMPAICSYAGLDSLPWDHPNNAGVRHNYSYLLSAMGKHNEAILEANIAQELEPPASAKLQ